MIVSGGFNIFPREIEDVVPSTPRCPVGVIGVPDEKWGEAVKAVVVLREGYGEPGSRERLTAEIRASVKERKGSVHAPKHVEYVDALPLTALGKPDKKALRATYWQGHARSV